MKALREKRIFLGISIEEAARALNIRKKYLIALEEGDIEEVLHSVYTKGYLKLYAKYLGVDDYENLNLGQTSDKAVRETGSSIQEIYHFQSNTGRNFKKIILLIFLGVTLIGLFLFLWYSSSKTKAQSIKISEGVDVLSKIYNK